ncbi:MAG: hypothetical protein JW912_05195 [Sedimentisphaerales bacterium]|nr:hypothetical protein [Sedimentisphaerales bacterium]
MTKTQAFIRYMFFCIFFALGAAAMLIAFKADEIKDYYQSKDLLTQTEQSNKKIENMLTEYDRQFSYIDSDPNILARLKPAVLGQQPQRDQTAFPVAPEKMIAKAKTALSSDQPIVASDNSVPQWATRIARPAISKALFFAGAGLILISFICFGTPDPKKLQHKRDRSTEP